MAFTPIPTGQDWLQNSTLVNEVTLGFTERSIAAKVHSAWAPSTYYSVTQVRFYNGFLYYCITAHTSGASFDSSKWKKWYDTSVTDLGTGRDEDCHTKEYQATWSCFYRMQYDIRYLLWNKFMDDQGESYNPDGTNYTTTQFPVFSDWDAFCSNAGLTNGLGEYGFRRAKVWEPPADPVWLALGSGKYGQAETGDIVGPWIAEDICTALTAMKWTFDEDENAKNSGDGGGCSSKQSRNASQFETGLPDPCQRARDGCETKYNAEAWSASTDTTYYYYVYRLMDSSGVWYWSSVYRTRSYPVYRGIQVPNACTYDWVVSLQTSIDQPAAGDNLDLDSTGWTNQQRKLWDTIAGSSSEDVTSTNEIYFGEAFPMDLQTSRECTSVPPSGSDGGTRVSQTDHIFRWNFTS